MAIPESLVLLDWSPLKSRANSEGGLSCFFSDIGRVPASEAGVPSTPRISDG